MNLLWYDRDKGYSEGEKEGEKVGQQSWWQLLSTEKSHRAVIGI